MLDQYILGQSSIKELVGIGAEIRLDLKLEANPYLNAAGISGITRDLEGDCLSGVNIEILDEDGNPLFHTISNLDGYYLFANLPPQKYFLLAIKEHFLLAKQVITLAKQEQLLVNWSLKVDPNWDLSIINGHVHQAETKLPVANATIFLSIRCGEHHQERIIAKTISNQFGQFLFQDLSSGRYRVIATANFYQTKTAEIRISPGHNIINQEFQLVVDPFAKQGTTSGQITDEHGMPVKDGLVVLYRVDKEQLHPVAFTYTNVTGDYLFTGLTDSQYLIKANSVKYCGNK